jgi:diguanylate cyclase (GGDEF)-like protein
MERRRLSRRSLLTPYVCAVVVAAIVVVAKAFARINLHQPFGSYPAQFASFALLGVLAELRPLKWLNRQSGGEVTASWTFSFALIFLAPAAAIPMVFVATAGADFVRGQRFTRTLFNAAQITLALAGAVAIVQLLDDPTSLLSAAQVGPQWLFAVALAGAVAIAINSLLTCVALALDQHLPIWPVLKSAAGVNLNMDGLLIAMAPVFVVVAVHGLLLVPLLLGTVWAIYRLAELALNHRHEATHDQLTGLPNRRFFYEQATLSLQQAARHHQRNVAVLHLDLDGFKGINDRLGHHVGDLVLREVARRLSAGRRSVDIIARLGGDEFAILLGDVPNGHTVIEVGERMAADLARPLSVDGVPVAIGGSFGVALYPNHGDDIDSLLRHADVAMYRAKTQGGGLELYDDRRDQRSTGRLGLLSELNDAIGTDQLSLVYQPKIDLRSGAVFGVEALIRWNHPRLGMVPPAMFMASAEHTELVTPISEFVLREALYQCADWHTRGLLIGVAVNCSARNLHDLRFPNLVAALLRETKVDPAWLEIEITENTVMSDPVRSAAVLGHLRSLGVTIAIDDFGTGYSSLASLRDLPIDRIKMDKSFVTGMAERSEDLMIVRSIIELAQNLGLGTVAEGVEDAEVLELLRQLSCDAVQGYLLGVPTSPHEFELRVRTGDFRTIILDPAA